MGRGQGGGEGDGRGIAAVRRYLCSPRKMPHTCRQSINQASMGVTMHAPRLSLTVKSGGYRTCTEPGTMVEYPGTATAPRTTTQHQQAAQQRAGTEHAQRVMELSAPLAVAAVGATHVPFIAYPAPPRVPPLANTTKLQEPVGVNGARLPVNPHAPPRVTIRLPKPPSRAFQESARTGDTLL